MLGEKDHFNWWQSAFFTQGSQVFLTPLFPRTRLLVQCNGVTRAAALVHDERIGVGQTYHLFRLPEEVEQAIHRFLLDQSLTSQTELFNSQEDLLNHIEQFAISGQPNEVGPVKVGSPKDLYDLETWRYVAQYYFSGFTLKNPVFPYFS